MLKLGDENPGRRIMLFKYIIPFASGLLIKFSFSQEADFQNMGVFSQLKAN